MRESNQGREPAENDSEQRGKKIRRGKIDAKAGLNETNPCLWAEKSSVAIARGPNAPRILLDDENTQDIQR